MRSYKFSILIFVFFLSATTIFSQSSPGLIFGGAKPDRGICIKKTSDNNLLSVGVTESFSNSQDAYLVKTDFKGKKIWEKNFGGSKEDNAWCFEEVEDGYLVSGFGNSFDSGEDILLIKTTKNGDLVWMKNLPYPGNERCWSIKKMSDGNFILIGQTQDRKTKNYDGLITKINASGKVLWQKKYGDSRYERLFYCSETKNHGIILAGISRKDSLAENVGVMLLVDKDGLQKKLSYLTTWKNTTAHGVLTVSKDHTLIYGYAQEVGNEKMQRSLYLALFDANGEMKWEKVAGDKNKVSHGLTAILTSTGSIMMAGYTRPLTNESWNGYVSIFDKEGILEQHTEFGSKESDDMPYSITEISPKEFVITGSRYVFSSGAADLWLVKVDDKGNVISF